MAVNLIEDITETKRHEIAQRLMAETLRTLAETPDLTEHAAGDRRRRGPEPRRLGRGEHGGRVRRHPDAGDRPPGPGQGADGVVPQPAMACRTTTSHSGLGAVIRSGEALLVHEITEEMLARRAQDPEHLGILREVGLNSAMIAPIRSGERILGALSFISCTSRRFRRARPASWPATSGARRG